MFLCLYVCVCGAVCVYECVHSAICVWTVQLVFICVQTTELEIESTGRKKNLDENNLEKINFRNNFKLSRYITDNHSNSTVPSQQTPAYKPELYSTISTSGSMEKSWGKAPARNVSKLLGF